MGFAAQMAVVGLALGAASATPLNSNGTVYTTEVVTALTTYCPAATTLTYGDKTYTVTSATTLTITDCPCTISKPVKPTATAPAKDACAQSCYDAYNTCRGKSGANMATCAAKYAECLGYSPFDNSGSLVTPTACSKKPYATGPAKGPYYTTEVVTAITTYCPSPTTLTYNNITIPVTKPTTITITDCPCTIKKPSPSSPSTPECAEECTDAYNTCRGKSGANMATCAAEYAQCLGYSPFGDDGSLITPSACSPGAPGTTAPSQPGKNTYTAPAQPGTPTGGKATGTAPSSPTTPTAVAAGAAHIGPAGLAVVLGAIALL